MAEIPAPQDPTSDGLTELERKLHAWIVQSEFHRVPWSTKKAAKAFKTKDEDIYAALAALSRKIPRRIQFTYRNGNLHVMAE